MGPACALALLLAATGPFPDLTVGVGALPSDLPIKGKPVAAAKWTDSAGLHALVVTETAEIENAHGRSKELYAYDFVRSGTTWKPLWKVRDFVTDCEFDLRLEAVRGSLAITDLDGDGTAESAFVYVLSCRSDVSPEVLKVILHEGAKKYALRGGTRVQVGVDASGRPEYTGGERQPDAALAGGPKAFLEHAQRLFDAAGGKSQK